MNKKEVLSIMIRIMFPVLRGSTKPKKGEYDPGKKACFH